MKETLRWGIIGPGRIAEKFAMDLSAVPGSVLYAVASQSGSRQLANQFKVPVWYESYEALATDPNVDAIYISTPHNFHNENVRLCLEAGKAVLCEKPLTVNASETEELIALSRRRQVFLMEAMWSRFLPTFSQVRKWLKDGRIGEIKFVTSSFGFQASGDPKSRWLNPWLAGGALLDLGIYPVALTQWVMGEDPERIQAVGLLSETGVDLLVAVNLRYSGEAAAQFSASLLGETPNEMVVLGTKGKIIVPSRFHQGTEAILEVNGRNPVRFQQQMRSGGFEFQIEEAVKLIRAGEIESPVMSHADSLENMRVMDEIRRQIGLRYPFEES